MTSELIEDRPMQDLVDLFLRLDAAVRDAAPSEELLKATVLIALRERGMAGATVSEVAELLQINPLAVRHGINSLRIEGHVQDLGNRRHSARGDREIVYLAHPQGAELMGASTKLVQHSAKPHAAGKGGIDG